MYANWFFVSMLYFYRRALNSNGPRTDPCGTPNGTDVGDELSLPIRTSCFLSAKYDLSQSSAAPVTPNLCLSLLNRMPWSIVSNAAVKSSSTSTTTQPLSTADKMSLCTFNFLFQLSGFADTPIASVHASCSHACGKLVAVPRHAQQLSK